MLITFFVSNVAIQVSCKSMSSILRGGAGPTPARIPRRLRSLLRPVAHGWHGHILVRHERPKHNLSALSTAPRLQLRTASSTTDTPRPGRPTTKARHATLATVCAARVSGQVDASAAGKSAVDEPAESREEWRAIEPRKGSYWRSLSSLSRPSAVTRQAICCAWSPKTGGPRLGPSKKRNLAGAQQVTEEV